MNFKLGEAYVELRAEDARYLAELARARSALSGLEARVKSFGSISGGVARGITQAFAGIFAVRGAVQGFEFIRDTALDMEESMMKLGRASGLTGSALERVGEDFRRFAGTNAGVDLKNVFDLGEIGAKLGIEGPKLSLFARDLAKMSTVLQGIPAEEAATRIARLLSIFRRGPDEAIRFASALNKLDLMSAATARDILDITNRLGPQASILGISPQETMALATAIRQAGVSAQTAGTSLSQLFNKMASRKDMGAFARIAGEPMERFKRTLNTMPMKALEQVALGIRRIGEKKGPVAAENALNKLGLEGYRTSITLLGLSTVLPKLAEYTQAANKDWYSLDSILVSFGQQGEIAKSKLKLMWNNVEILANKLGIALLPTIKDFAEGVVGLTRDIGRWVDKNQELFKGWGRNIGSFFRDLGALPRTWKLHMELIQLVGQEKMEQLIQIFKNSREPLVQTFAWLAESATTVFAATIGKGARKAGVDFSKMFTDTALSTLESLPGGGFLIKQIFGADAKVVRDTAASVAKIAKQAIDREKFQLPAPPAFAAADLFKNLPNRAGDIAAKRAEIQKERGAQDRERAADKASDEAEDAATRRRAGAMRHSAGLHQQAVQFFRGQQARQRMDPRLQFNQQVRQERETMIQRDRWERQNAIRMFRGQAPLPFEMPGERRGPGVPGGGNLLPQQNREPLVQGVDEVAKNTGTTNDKLDQLLAAIEDLNLGLV